MLLLQGVNRGQWCQHHLGAKLPYAIGTSGLLKPLNLAKLVEKYKEYYLFMRPQHLMEPTPTPVVKCSGSAPDATFVFNHVYALASSTWTSLQNLFENTVF